MSQLKFYLCKKPDIVLLAGFAVIALMLWAIPLAATARADTAAASQAVVRVGGQVVMVLPLDKDGTYPITRHNTVAVHNGAIQMIYADCPDKLCQRQHASRATGGAIVCLPNKTTVEVVTQDPGGADAYAR